MGEVLAFTREAAIERKTERAASGDLLADSGLSASAQRAYGRAWRQFREWYGEELPALTASEFDSLVADFARSMFASGKAPKTIYQYVAGIKWHLVELFGANGPWRQWLRAWRGIRREGRDRGNGQKDGLTWLQADQLAQRAPDARKGSVGIRDAAMILCAKDGLLRASEVRAIDVEHIERLPNGGARLYIPSSKTDQSGKGAYRTLDPSTVNALDRWLKVAQIHSGAVFISVGGPGARERKRIRTLTVCEIVKIHCKLAGFTGNYGSHSLRIGGAQEMARRGARDMEIMHAGGWSSVEMAAHYARPQRAEAGPAAKYRAMELEERS